MWNLRIGVELGTLKEMVALKRAMSVKYKCKWF